MTAHVEQVADEIWYAIRDMILFQKKKKEEKTLSPRACCKNTIL